MSQSISQSVSLSFSQSVSQSVNQQSVCLDPRISLPDSQSCNQSVGFGSVSQSLYAQVIVHSFHTASFTEIKFWFLSLLPGILSHC